MCASVGRAQAVCVLPPADDRNRPPKHAVVAAIDEKSRIQARDRTPPDLPLTHGKCGRMTRDYRRGGAPTLFAALIVLDGTVIRRCMRRHRREKLIRFVSAVERAAPAGKVTHAVVDDTVAHKQPDVLKRLADHLCWTFHFTPPPPLGSTPSRASSPTSQRDPSALSTPSPPTSTPTTRRPIRSSGPLRRNQLRQALPDPCASCLSPCVRSPLACRRVARLTDELLLL